MIIKNGDVILPGQEEPVKLDIGIEGGRITSIGTDLHIEGEQVDARNLLVLPGGIDPHVHFNDPGYTSREDFAHGSAAAASGGITTVIDMPCTSVPPVTNLTNLREKLSAVENRSVVDFGLFGGVSAQSYADGFAENMRELADFVLGFKTYFISGMDTFERLNLFQFQKVLEISQKVNRPVLLHAEDFDYIREATREAAAAGSLPENYYNSRPEIAEITAVGNAVDLAETVGSDLHIVHVATARAGEKLAQSRVTGETAPHYLEFDTDDFIRMGATLKVTPVIKSAGNKEKLWRLLSNDVINFVASDHAPCPAEGKSTGSIWTDYSGISGTNTLLPYVFSEGYMKGKLTLGRMVEVTSSAAAVRYGIFHRKGSIEVGKDADFVLVDPRQDWKIDGPAFYSKGKITPFQDRTFKGRVVRAMVRGTTVYEFRQGILAEPGHGRLVSVLRSKS